MQKFQVSSIIHLKYANMTILVFGRSQIFRYERTCISLLNKISRWYIKLSCIILTIMTRKMSVKIQISLNTLKMIWWQTNTPKGPPMNNWGGLSITLFFRLRSLLLKCIPLMHTAAVLLHVYSLLEGIWLNFVNHWSNSYF